jgi:hypothetical protein
MPASRSSAPFSILLTRMLEIAPGTARLQKVRLVTRARDPCLLQIRLGSALQAASFRPPGLPDAVILCIRRLTILPTMVLRLDEARLPGEWEQAVASRLEDLVRRAGRPAWGDVSVNAPAVLFADHAELLACLGRDWLEDRLGDRWWWRSLLVRPPAGEVVIACWAEAPEHVPAGLELLASWNLAPPFVHIFEPPAARHLLEGLIHSFGLGDLQRALARPPEPDEESPVGSRSDTGGMPAPAAGEAPVHHRVAGLPPWQDFAPESLPPGLHPEQQLLLGIGLGLLRAPQEVRSAAFAAAARAWSSVIVASAGSPEPDAPSLPGGLQGGELPPAGTSADSALNPWLRAAPARATVLQEHGPVREAQGSEDRTPSGGIAPCASTSPVPGSDQVRVSSTDGQSVAPAPPREPDAPREEKTPGETQAHRAGPAVPGERLPPLQPAASVSTVVPVLAVLSAAAPFEGESIETGLGGLFYLINLALFLGLYADFTAPLQAGIPLSPWDFIALVGGRLLWERGWDDPLWDMLARLAGRTPGQPAGMNFEPPSDWRLPPAWLDSFPGGTWKWFVSCGRLVVRAPSGFSVLDIPVEAGCPDPAGLLERELLPYQPCQVRQTRGRGAQASSGAQGGLDAWLDRFVEYAGARLCRALGLKRREEIPACLCLHSARLRLTSSRLDVTFSLSRHPLVIRLAGLDRDPGWVPAGGRTIVFHYE